MTAAKKRYKRIFLCILGVILVAIFLFPIYWMIISSLKSSGEIFKVPPSFVPESLYLENYLSLFRNPDFFNYIKNSTIISVFSMIGAIILGSADGLCAGEKKSQGTGSCCCFHHYHSDGAGKFHGTASVRYVFQVAYYKQLLRCDYCQHYIVTAVYRVSIKNIIFEYFAGFGRCSAH